MNSNDDSADNEYYENLCKDIMSLDPAIRFSMIIVDGIKKYGGYRDDVASILDSDELSNSILHAHQRMKGRYLVEDKLGTTKYAMAEYEKVKRVTFPINKQILLLVSMDPNSDHNKIIDLILHLIKS